MNFVKGFYCRIFQSVLKIAIPVLPYRSPRILHSVADIPVLLAERNITRIMIITDVFLHRSGKLEPMKKALTDAGVTVTIYDEVVPDPTIRNVEIARERYIENSCQALIGFGGGSARAQQNAPRRGENIMSRLELTFEEAAFGCERELSTPRIENCPNCSGSGSADGVIETCSNCHGSGRVTVMQNVMGMRMQTQTTCSHCSGRGKIVKNPCTTCKGKGKVRKTNKVKVKIPAGIDEGQSVRVRGEGSVGVNGGPNGDLLVEILIRRHPIFEREYNDVLCEVPITFTQAALGAEIQVPTLDGKVSYTIPEGTQTGREFVIREKGIPEVNNPRRRGNHRFTVVVETPTKLTKEQKELLRQLDSTLERNETPKIKKFFDNLKDFFE